MLTAMKQETFLPNIFLKSSTTGSEMISARDANTPNALPSPSHVQRDRALTAVFLMVDGNLLTMANNEAILGFIFRQRRIVPFLLSPQPPILFLTASDFDESGLRVTNSETGILGGYWLPHVPEDWWLNASSRADLELHRVPALDRDCLLVLSLRDNKANCFLQAKDEAE